MTKITLVIDDELEARFREAAFKRYSLFRGSLSKLAEDAIRLVLKEIAEEGKTK